MAEEAKDAEAAAGPRQRQRVTKVDERRALTPELREQLRQDHFPWLESLELQRMPKEVDALQQLVPAALEQGRLPMLVSLRLNGNALGDEGIALIASALRHAPALYSLNVRENGFGDVGAEALAVAMAGLPRLTNLNVSRNLLTSEGMMALADATKHTPQLACFDISFNSFTPRISLYCFNLPIGQDCTAAVQERVREHVPRCKCMVFEQAGLLKFT